MKQCYEITIQGHLTQPLAAVFDEMEVCCHQDGNTHIIGELTDQAALYGLLMRLRDMGMTLISVNPALSHIPTTGSVIK